MVERCYIHASLRICVCMSVCTKLAILITFDMHITNNVTIRNNSVSMRCILFMKIANERDMYRWKNNLELYGR